MQQQHQQYDDEHYLQPSEVTQQPRQQSPNVTHEVHPLSHNHIHQFIPNGYLIPPPAMIPIFPNQANATHHPTSVFPDHSGTAGATTAVYIPHSQFVFNQQMSSQPYIPAAGTAYIPAGIPPYTTHQQPEPLYHHQTNLQFPVSLAPPPSSVPLLNPFAKSFVMPDNIFPFSIDFGELNRKELDEIMLQQSSITGKKAHISWYTAWIELKKGKRDHLFEIGETPNPSDFIPVSRNHTDDVSDHESPDGTDMRTRLRNLAIHLPRPARKMKRAVVIPNNISTAKDSSLLVSDNKPAAGESSWASLFRHSAEDHVVNPTHIEITRDRGASISTSLSSDNRSFYTPLVLSPRSLTRSRRSSFRQTSGLEDFIRNYQPICNKLLLIPRGLVNRGNMCFMNSILQPLLHCGPFYDFVSTLAIYVPHDFNNTRPLIDAIIMFIKEFVLDDGSDDDLLSGRKPFSDSFIPEYVYDALNADERFKSTKGRQQDAEEFLGFLLDGIHEELMKDLSSPEDDFSLPQNTEWIEVGAKQKPAVTRNLEIKDSPITRIFGGTMRSILKRPGQKDSINIEPFHSLQLNISHDDVQSVKDALIHHTQPEIIEGFTTPTGQLATKQILVERLPPVLILHLKRFVFVDGKTQKLQKHIEYGLELEISSEITSMAQHEQRTTNSNTSITPKYRLFGAVFHHGKSATDGHYSCDVLRANGQWLNFDDTIITRITEQQVLEKPQDRSAYILFYIRNDEDDFFQ